MYPLNAYNGRLAWRISDLRIILDGGFAINKGDKSLKGPPKLKANSWGNFKHASWANHPEIA